MFYKPEVEDGTFQTPSSNDTELTELSSDEKEMPSSSFNETRTDSYPNHTSDENVTEPALLNQTEEINPEVEESGSGSGEPDQEDTETEASGSPDDAITLDTSLGRLDMVVEEEKPTITEASIVTMANHIPLRPQVCYCRPVKDKECEKRLSKSEAHLEAVLGLLEVTKNN